VGFLLGLFFDPEDEGDKSLWNVSWLSMDYMVLFPKRQNCTENTDVFCEQIISIFMMELVTTYDIQNNIYSSKVWGNNDDGPSATPAPWSDTIYWASPWLTLTQPYPLNKVVCLFMYSISGKYDVKFVHSRKLY
jgi:hypothetical protein